MNANLEKAIIVGSSDETYFLVSSNDDLIMRKNNSNRNFSIGDCVEISSTSNTGWISLNGERQNKRVVEKCEKIEPFVERQLQNNMNGVYIKSNIIDITIKGHPNTNKPVRCFRTNFLKEIYDNEISRTDMYTDRELMQMKVVANHVVSYRRKGLWTVLNVHNPKDKNSNGFLGHNGRIHLKGISLRMPQDHSKNGRNDIYFWVPFRRDQVMYKEEIRGNASKIDFLGNWVSFDVNMGNRIDELSQVRMIDDVLPTRYYSRRYEVRVRVSFDEREWNQRSYPELSSNHCNLIADISGTLKKYNRLSSFSDDAWVHYFPHEPQRNIRFVLSEKQEEWENTSKNDRLYQSNDDERNTDDYDQDRIDMRTHELSRNVFPNYGGNSKNREKLKKSSRNSSGHFDENKSETRSREEDEAQNYRNEYPENQRFGISRKGDFNKKEHVDEERNRRRERSRPPANNESFEKSEDDFHVENEKKVDRNEYERGGISRAPLRNEEYRDQKDEHRRPEKQETFLTPSRSKRSSSSKRDDVSVPSSSKSIDESTNIQWNLKKLKRRYEYLIANDMDIPEKLKEDIANAILEEQRSSKKKTIDYSDFDDDSSGISEIRKRRELAKIEVNEEELKTYKELVILFREMLASPRVCEEMRRYDEKAMKEINRLIFDL